MAITGAIYFTGAFATLVGGIYWKRASRIGAYAAFFCGFLMVLGLKPMQDLVHVNWPSHYVGLVVAALAIVTCSLFAALPGPPLDYARDGPCGRGGVTLSPSKGRKEEG